MKIPNIIANVIASVSTSILFAIIYMISYSPPEWACVGATILFASIVYFYCSLVDVIRECGAHNAE